MRGPLAAAFLFVTAIAAAGPLTNEDIVRLVMTGTSETAVLEAIVSSPVNFDLAPDVVRELRTAGVGDRIIEAMRRRQAETSPPEPAPSPIPAVDPRGTLEISLVTPPEGGGDPTPAATALKALPHGTKRRAGAAPPLMTDLAFVVLCTTSDHVPDHWEARSPLTRAPRHEVILFRPGSAEATVRGARILTLRHDPAYRLQIAAGTHNIVVGAAGLESGTSAWRLIASDGARVAVEAGGIVRIRVTARGRAPAGPGGAPENEWKVAAGNGP